jgi:hypothetical protein
MRFFYMDHLNKRIMSSSKIGTPVPSGYYLVWKAKKKLKESFDLFRLKNKNEHLQNTQEIASLYLWKSSVIMLI